MRYAIVTLLMFTSLECTAAVRTVALSDNFGFTLWPVLNNAGQVGYVFRGDAWVNDNGSLQLIAQHGAPAPGTNRYFSSIGYVRLNESGQVAFNSLLADSADGRPDFADEGVWLWNSGVIEKVARAGDQAPGTPPGVVFERTTSRTIANSTINDAGQIVFSPQLAGPGVTQSNNGGIWLGTSGSLRLLAREGDPAAGMPAGVIFDWIPPVLYPNAGVLNHAGQTVFRGLVTGPGVDAGDNSGVWYWNGDSLELIAHEGQQAAGTAAGTQWGNFISNDNNAGLHHPTLNNRGQAAFFGELRGPGVDDSNNRGIWLRDNGSFNLIVRTGDLAPGTSADLRFHTFNEFALNGSGEIAFGANITGPGATTDNSWGIWAGTADSLRLVARMGDPAPGTDPATVFYALLPNQGAGPALNARGQVLFYGSLAGPGIDATNDFGVWAETVDHVLTLIARTGDQLEVAPGDRRTISFLTFPSFGSGNEDGRGSTFNDRGEVVFKAEFTDGSSGIFLSDLVAVPEPSSYCLMAAAVVSVLMGRKGRGEKSFRNECHLVKSNCLSSNAFGQLFG